jgi:formylglycine-generating enzyme required for sulfatase activity
VDLLADTLAEALSKNDKLTVISPAQLKRALVDALSGKFSECFDKLCQFSLSREVKADLVLATRITGVGSQCVLTAKIWDLATEVGFHSATGRTACKRSQLLDQIEFMAHRLADLPARPVPKTAALAKPRPTKALPLRGPWRPPTRKWIFIPAGRFQMGPADSEILPQQRKRFPSHPVRLTRSLVMKATEVTQAEWIALMGVNPSKHKSCGLQCPVEQVSWWDALAFLNALSKSDGLPPCYDLSSCKGQPGADFHCERLRFLGLTCKGYRLPTEAEWEYAARAGSPKGAVPALIESAWFAGNAGGSPRRVASLQPNPWGLFDMAGNLFEWVHDWAGPMRKKAERDPLGPKKGKQRLLKSCAYESGSSQCVYTSRHLAGPFGRDPAIGLRPVRSLKKGVKP